MSSLVHNIKQNIVDILAIPCRADFNCLLRCVKVYVIEALVYSQGHSELCRVFADISISRRSVKVDR